MKRYSVSIAYGIGKNGKIHYHYCDRTDSVENAVESYKRSLESWVETLNNESYPYRSQINPYHGIKITDSQTKKTVYEESHFPEEFGWKAVWTEHKNEEFGFTYKKVSYERI